MDSHELTQYVHIIVANITVCWQRCQTDRLLRALSAHLSNCQMKPDGTLETSGCKPATSCMDKAQKIHQRKQITACDSEAEVETGL